MDPNRDPKQVQAICYSQWRRESMHPDFMRIQSLFLKQFGNDVGSDKFLRFVLQNDLDTSKAYDPRAQFRESFSWIEPLISFYSQDAEAKYYKVRCLTANISMNNNDYSNFDQLMQAASSLTYRPVNINHDHNRWLPFPRTRVDFTKAEDMSIEATLRVDNEDSWLQQALDDGSILHPSIEGRKDPSGDGFHFTGMAFLEKGVELPGDPLTEIQPLVLNEAVGKAVCKLINGKIVCNSNCEINLKESEKQTMNKQMKEQELPLPNQCVCPECGQVDELTEKDCSLQKCSRDSCGHQMRQQPNQDAHTGLGGGEAKEAFGDASFPDSCFAYVPDSAKGPDGNKSDRKLPYKNADGTVDLPHVRNALARLNQTDDISAQEKDRIRGMLQNILKRETPGYEPTEMLEQLAGKDRQIAELTENVYKVTKELEDVEAGKTVAEKDLVESKKDLVKKQKEIVVFTENEARYKTSLEEAHKLSGSLKADMDKLQGSYDRAQADLKEAKNQQEYMEETIAKLNRQVGEHKEELLKLKREMNELSSRLAEAKQTALNETNERSNVQKENALLSEEVAKLTREKSDLSQLRAEQAKKIYGFEKKDADRMQEIKVRDDEIAKLKERIIKSLKFQSWAHRELRNAGIAFVEKAEVSDKTKT